MHSQSLPSDFSLEDRSFDKADTYSTPRNLSKNKGFAPYKELNATDMKDEREEFQGISERINYETNTF